MTDPVVLSLADIRQVGGSADKPTFTLVFSNTAGQVQSWLVPADLNIVFLTNNQATSNVVVSLDGTLYGSINNKGTIFPNLIAVLSGNFARSFFLNHLVKKDAQIFVHAETAASIISMVCRYV